MDENGLVKDGLVLKMVKGGLVPKSKTGTQRESARGRAAYNQTKFNPVTDFCNIW
jgi:hypothetical protein